MVRMKNLSTPKVRSVYYLKPGQTLENTKAEERTLALIVPQSEYERFQDYVHEKERAALLAERERKRLQAFKKATYEMSKTWEDTAQNVAIRRKQELLSRKKREEEARIQFTKDMAVKNAIERAEIVKQAKELLLYQKPQCRAINRALLISECFRELDEQLKFNKSLKEVEKQLEEKYAASIVEDVSKFQKEEEKRKKNLEKKHANYQAELITQIQKRKKIADKMAEATRKDEIEELKDMAKEMKEIEEEERKREFEKRETLKKMFLSGIQEKYEMEKKLEMESEFQDKSLKTYLEMKREMEKIAKEKSKKIIEEKILKTDVLARKFVEAMEKGNGGRKKTRKDKADEDDAKERERAEIEREEEKKRKKEQDKLEWLESLKKAEEEMALKRKEEEDMKLWEMQQRYKRDEFNKNWDLKYLEEERKKKLAYGKMLKRQMAIQEADRKKEMEEDVIQEQMKEMIDRLNQKILNYGEKVIKESEGVRPLFPIVKTVETFKREIGLKPPSAIENTESPKRPKRKRGKKFFCTKPVSEKDAFSFA